MENFKMKKSLLAMLVMTSALVGVNAANAAEPASVTVNGGTVKFEGTVVDAACAVSNESINQTVILDQVRTVRLATAGTAAGQQKDFNIKLLDCDTTVSQNASVTFNGQADGTTATALANTAGAGAAKNVALQLYGPDGKVLAVGDESSTITLVDGTNVIPLSVDYVATAAAATAGSVAATATFNVTYS
jgi:type 1 fimbria pilin